MRLIRHRHHDEFWAERHISKVLWGKAWCDQNIECNTNERENRDDVCRRDGRNVSRSTKLKDEIAYWSQRIDECDIGCDWSDAANHCWRCGCESQLQRCHIVPRSLGGKDAPGNIIGLCARCHDEMPNVIDPDEVWRWIKNDHGSYYDNFWQQRAMATAFNNEQRIALAGCNVETFSQNVRDACSCIGLHAGQHEQGVYMSTSSLVWALRLAHDLTILGESIAAYQNQKPNKKEHT